MLKHAQRFRWVFTGVTVFVLLPVITTWVTEFARDVGVFEKPADQVKGLLFWAAALASNWWTACVLGLSGGIALGLWFNVWLQEETPRAKSGLSAKHTFHPTRLRIKALPDGTAVEQINQNVIWQQVVLSMTGHGDKGEVPIVRHDTISFAFVEPIDHERPIVESFGHPIKVVGMYPLGGRGYVISINDGLPPMLEITFPPLGHYEQETIRNLQQESAMQDAGTNPS